MTPPPGRGTRRTQRAAPLWWWLAVFLLCLLPCSGVAAAAASFLHTQGQDIVNEQGQKVLLRGVGLGNWMLPEGYMWKFGNQGDRPRRIEKIVSDLIGPENASRFWSSYRKDYIAEADIARIAELGFNSVRPALNARLFLTETDPPQPVAEGYQLLDDLVKRCREHGLYVIIDMHGAPGGQTGQNIDDSANDQPELFVEPKYQDRLVDLWTSLARRYKDEPAVAGYDLLNEPLPQRTGAAEKYKAQVEPLYRRLAKAIREVDSRHMIILEGVDWANDWSIFTTPFDKNLVYQFHYYCWDNPARLKSIQRYLDYRKKFNAPVWVGETGERDNAIYWATTEYFEANNIGWSFWPWKKMDAANGPCSIKRPAQWDAVVACSRGEAKPGAEVAQRAFDELLTNIRLENCVFHADVVNALLRRAPARIEAENFGQGGPGVSYGVTAASRRSECYRLDQPVSIKASEAQRPRSGQYITLADTEWAAYTIFSDSKMEGAIKLRARSPVGPAAADLQVGDRKLEVKVTEGDWTEFDLGSISLAAGANHLKWTVRHGTVDLDWIEVRETEGSRASASIGRRASKN
jgi:hypothetical protein